MGLADLFTGTPPQLGIGVTNAQKPPMFSFARDFGDYLRSLIGQNLPSYQGPIDPGMSPTMQHAGVMSQAYSQSPLPSIMGQAQGTLSRFMSPSFANPMARMQMGTPNYFPSAPGQQVFGGGQPMNPLTPQGPQMPGMPGPPAPAAGGGAYLEPWQQNTPSAPAGPQTAAMPDIQQLMAALRGGS